MMTHPTTLAFDFGGTKIDICRLSKLGEILEKTKIKTADLEPGHVSFLERALVLFSQHIKKSDDKIGLSWNAPVHEGRLIYSSLLGGQVNIDLDLLLRQKFRRRAQVESDVHAMALGEYRFGLGTEAAPFVLVNLGSGFGIAYHDQCLMRGISGGAGLICKEKYFVPDIDQHVILDHLFSGRGISYLHHAMTGERLTAHALADKALGGDIQAARPFQIMAPLFGSMLVSLSRLFNPKSIILAGSLTKASALFLPMALEILGEQVEPACRPHQIILSKLAAPACLGLV